MKLLLHTCCAPCSVYCIKTLRKNGIEPTLYWYNPNIHPYQEYKARRNCLREYAKTVKVDLLEDDAYGLDEFVCNTYDKVSTRCRDYCYPKRLRQAFEFAKDNGFDTITTTLLYSIYQQHDFIKELMENLSAERRAALASICKSIVAVYSPKRSLSSGAKLLARCKKPAFRQLMLMSAKSSKRAKLIILSSRARCRKTSNKISPV